MSNSLCKTSVFKAYQDVMADVISNVREHFLEDGVDEIVLQELNQLWQNKLAATKVVSEHKEPEKVVALNNKSSKHDGNNGNAYVKAPPSAQQIRLQQQQLQQQALNKQVVGQVPPNNHIPQGALVQAFPDWRRLPIQLTIPSAPGSTEGNRILSVDVPEVFLQGPHLKSILTGQVISTTMELPLAAACAYLQNHVDLAFRKHQENILSMNIGSINPSVLQNALVDNRLQSDGTADTSDHSSLYNNVLKKTNVLPNERMIHQEDGAADSSEADITDNAQVDLENNVAFGIKHKLLNMCHVSAVDLAAEYCNDYVIECKDDKTSSTNQNT